MIRVASPDSRVQSLEQPQHICQMDTDVQAGFKTTAIHAPFALTLRSNVQTSRSDDVNSRYQAAP